MVMQQMAINIIRARSWMRKERELDEEPENDCRQGMARREGVAGQGGTGNRASIDDL